MLDWLINARWQWVRSSLLLLCLSSSVLAQQSCPIRYAEPFVPEIPPGSVQVNLTDFPPTADDWTDSFLQVQEYIDQQFGAGTQAFVRIPPGEYRMKSSCIPRSNTTYYGGGTLIRDESLEDMIVFGLGGSNGSPLKNIVLAGLILDSNGFRSGGALVQWNSRRDLRDSVIQNLTFLDSNCPQTQHDEDVLGGQHTDDWCINLGGWNQLQNLTIKNCVHNSPVHQFCAGGHKEGSSIDGLYFRDNTIYGSRSVTISVLGHRGGGMTYRNVEITGNRIYNPWRHAIAIGLDASHPDPRFVSFQGVKVRDNLIQWDEAGNDYSSALEANGILIKLGDREDSVFEDVVICENTVINVDGEHVSKDVGGIWVGGGVHAPAPQIVIFNNEFPTVSVHRVNHSLIHAQNNIMGRNSIVSEDIPSSLNLDAYDFNKMNDIPTLAETIMLDTNSLRMSFRIYVPHYPKPGRYYHIFHYDDENYLRMAPGGAIELCIGGQSRTLIEGGALAENTTYKLVIEGQGDGSIITRYNGIWVAPQQFDAPFFYIDHFGAAIGSDTIYSATHALLGFIWNVHFSDDSGVVNYTGTFQDDGVDAWRDLSGSKHGYPTALHPFVFDGVTRVPVPTFPIVKSYDNLDIQFKFHATDLTSSAYLFVQDNMEFIRINTNGSIVLRENGVQHTLVFGDFIKANRSYQMHIRDVDDGPGVRLQAFINGSGAPAGPTVEISNSATPESDGLLTIRSIGARMGPAPRPFKGIMWDIRITDQDYEIVYTEDSELYDGTQRGENPLWHDRRGGSFPVRNHAYLTPIVPFNFGGEEIVRFFELFQFKYDGLKLSFRMRVDELNGTSFLFYQDAGNNILLRPDGGLQLQEDIPGDGMPSDTQVLFFDEHIEEGGVYFVEIYEESSRLYTRVNGKPGPSAGVLPVHPNLLIRYIGGEIGGGGLFKGAIWDVTLRGPGGFEAYYPGDYTVDGFEPWEDVTGNSGNGVVVEVGN